MKKILYSPFAGFLLAVSLAPTADARILEIFTLAEIPEPDGYTRIIGRAHGAINPNQRQNAVIQDIRRAATNADGLVQYSMDFMILKPPGGGNGLLFYEAPNVGFPTVELPEFFKPIGDLARERGYSIVTSGWEAHLDQENAPGPQLTISVPVAFAKDGKTIKRRVRTAYVPVVPQATLPLAGTTVVPQLAFEPADPGESKAELTRRRTRNDKPELVARESWAFGDCASTPFPGVPSKQHICLQGSFDPNYIYELVYRAKSPEVRGLGFAATRDLVAFLRNAQHDVLGNLNPLAGQTRSAIMFGVSLSGSFARQFLHLGFNEDEDRRAVFDAMNFHIAPGRLALNVRFETPQLPPIQHAPLIPSMEFPFSTHRRSYDPLTKRSGWIQARCRRTRTCPKIMETWTSAEYWQFRASLATTNSRGRRDLNAVNNVRTYLFSSAAHTIAPAPVSTQLCQLPLNWNDYRPNLRALIVALENWVMNSIEPPASQIPRIKDGTLASATAVGWPGLPGVHFEGKFNNAPLVDFGRRFDSFDMSGVLREPPKIVRHANHKREGAERRRAKHYNVLLPRVDEDGNDIAGIRGVAIRAPLGTYTGWNLRAAGFAEGELCELFGGYIPLATTKVERQSNGDPRLSLEERYSTHEGYVDAVRNAVDELLAQGFLLPQDADVIVQQAMESSVLRN